MMTTDRRQFLGAGLGLSALALTEPALSRSTQKRWTGVAKAMSRLVDAGTLPGAVLLVRQHGKTVVHEAIGYQNLESRAAMQLDTMFQTMSTSKTYIAAAVMILVDRSQIALNAPVAQYLPEFGDPWLATPNAAGQRVLTRPARPITVADLLTHGSGLPDAPPAIRSFATKMHYSLAEVVMAMSQQPLDAEPGARFRYSNIGIAVAARIVEVVSGRSYEQFVADEIFAPLGAHNSCFRLTAEQAPRLASAYRLDNGTLRPFDDKGPGDPAYVLRTGARYILPEAGIYATAADMADYFQMVLDGGSFNGRRILSREAVTTMLQPRLPITSGSAASTVSASLGWRVATAPGGSDSSPMTEVGSFGHSGALGSYAHADPKLGIVAVLMIQCLPAEVARQTFVTEIKNAAR